MAKKVTNVSKSVKGGSDEADFFVVTVWIIARKKAQNIVMVKMKF